MTLPNYPVGAQQREAQLVTQVSSQAKAWILAEAARLVPQAEVTEQVALAKVRARFSSFGSIPEADINALAFMLLMLVAEAAQMDLKAIMVGIKAINVAKERARHANSGAKSSVTVLQRGHPATFSATTIPKPKAAIARRPTSTVPIAKMLLDSQINMARNDADKLIEMGEMESLRLQMAMDRASKIMTTLSNIQKKMSSTRSSIIQNLK